MIERHRESQALWGRAGAILLVLGLLIAGYGLMAAVGWHSSLFWLGLFVAAMSVAPFAEMLDRRDRANGLGRLRSEWISITRASDAQSEDVDRLANLVRKTHG